MDQKAIARERAKNKVCIICEDSTSRLTRGLCIKHHTRYLTARKRVESDGGDGDEYDEFLIAQGLLLPSRKGKRLDIGENVFDDAAAEFLGVPSLETAEYQANKGKRKPADQAASELAEKAEEHKSVGKGSKGKRTKKKQ